MTTSRRQSVYQRRGELASQIKVDHPYSNTGPESIPAQKQQSLFLPTPMSSPVVDVASIPHEHHKAMIENLELKDQLASLQNKVQEQDKMLSFLSEDQRLFLKLGNGHFRGRKWSDETLQNALKLRFSCGATGYDDLLKAGFPLPAISTLQQRTEHIKFESGILTEVFEMMAQKVKTMDEREVWCALTMDEMSLKESVDYDLKSDSFIGDVTLPHHSGRATKAFCFQLGGLTVRWKQVVGYFFTGNSVRGEVVGPINTEIIEKAHGIGLKVASLTNDFGSSNLACWN